MNHRIVKAGRADGGGTIAGMLVPGDLVALTQTIGMIDGPIPGTVIAVGPGRPGRPPKYVLEAGTELRVRTFPRDESVAAVAEGVSKNLIMGVPVSVLRLVKEAPGRDAVIAAERAEREKLATSAAVVAKRKKRARPTRPIPKDCTVCWVRDARKLARYGFDREGAEAAGEQLFDVVGIHTADDERVEFVAICGLSVVGAITFAERDGEPTLSVAIDRDWQKKNLGRRLAEALLAKHEGNYYVQVINPNMAKILTDLGFEAESRYGWSRESPMMKR